MKLPPDLKVLIVDDNEGFCHLLQILLRETGVQYIVSAHDFISGWAEFQSFEPHIAILDIDLGKGEKSGIELAETIRYHHVSTPIIYLTANYSEEYYQKSRHTRPSSFLNKELSRFKIHQALDLAMMQSEQKTQPRQPASLLPGYTPPLITSQQFFFKIGDIYKSIPVKDIAYFYADNKLTYARIGQRNYPTNVQLKTLEEEFTGFFARIHKTYLININLIESIQPKESVVTINGESLPIGYAYRKTFLDQLHLLR